MQESWWHRQFKGQGYRLTMPRKAIFEVLSKTSKHLSAEDVYWAVHKKYSTIGLTTVYRTLELLYRMGIVVKFAFGDGRSRYELASGPDVKRHHHHLVCTNCGRIIDYSELIKEETRISRELEKILSNKYNFKIESHQISFFGLCEKCQNDLEKEEKRSDKKAAL